MRFNLLFIFVALFVVASVTAPQFLTSQNMANLLQQSSLTGIVAIGMTVVILTSGIDLSVGSVAALSGIVVAILIGLAIAWPIAMVLAITSGLAGMQSIRGLTFPDHQWHTHHRKDPGRPAVPGRRNCRRHSGRRADLRDHRRDRGSGAAPHHFR